MNQPKHTETTEWDDLQIKMGNMAPKAIWRAPTAEEYDAESLAIQDSVDHIKQKVLEGASLEQLDALEDVEDEKILEALRKKRMEELKAKAAREKFGELVLITEQDYKKAVNEKDLWVIVLLFNYGHFHSQILENAIKIIAKRCRATKFVSIIAKDAIHNYPEKNVPTLLIYHNGELKTQFITLAAFGGENLSADIVEWELKQIGAVESQIDRNPRLPKKNAFQLKERLGYIKATKDSDDEEDED